MSKVAGALALVGGYVLHRLGPEWRAFIAHLAADLWLNRKEQTWP